MRRNPSIDDFNAKGFSMFIGLERPRPKIGFAVCIMVSMIMQLEAADLTDVNSTKLFESDVPVPQSFDAGPAADTNLNPGVDSSAENREPSVTSELNLPQSAATVMPYQMAPLVTATPKPPTPPKKPVPPVFPGPMVLPPVGPWKLLYFDNDFRTYKKDPKHQYLPGEELKDMPLEVFGIPMLLSTGGEIRERYMNEANRLRPGGIPVGHSTDYNLVRWRHYFDLRVGDVRLYFEGIEADSFGSSLPNQPIDVDRWDILNLFADWKFYDDGSETQTARYGRQELSYGKQRLISPLDWANTRRNFEGGRYIAKGQDYQFDLFCTHPVNAATGFSTVAYDANHLDQPNRQVFFSGAYLNYTGVKNTSIDAYWLFLDTTSLVNASLPIGARHTIGSRYGALYPVAGGSRVWDFDTEGAIQFGNNQSQQVLAGFYTAVGGHTWKDVPYTPRVSGSFYYGSGSNSKGSTSGTFNTLFPLSHAYWALSDNVNGENLINYALQAEAKPTAKTAITSAYHWFQQPTPTTISTRFQARRSRLRHTDQVVTSAQPWMSMGITHSARRSTFRRGTRGFSSATIFKPLETTVPIALNSIFRRRTVTDISRRNS